MTQIGLSIPQSDERHHCGLTGELTTKTFYMPTAETDQTGQMPMLISVFVFAYTTLLLFLLIRVQLICS